MSKPQRMPTRRTLGDGSDFDVLASTEAGPAAIRGGALRVAGYIAGALLTAGAAALLFRHLGVVDTGRYVTGLSIVAVVAGLSDLGLTAIGVRELAIRDADSRRRLAANLLGLRMVVAVAGLLVAVAFTGAAGYGSVLVAGVAVAGVGLLFQSVQSTLAISLMSSLRLGWVTAADLLRQVVSVLLIAAGVIAGAGLLAFLAVPLPASLLALGLTALLVRGTIPLLPRFEWAEWRGLLRVVLPYSAAVAAATLYFRLAIILVSLIASARELGYFSASYRVIEALAVIPTLLVGSAFPIFARAAHDDRVRLRYALGRVFDVSVILGAWVVLGVALGAPLAIDIIGGSKFAPAADVLAIQGVALGATFVGAVWANALLSLAHHREILALNVSALVIGGALVAFLAAAEAAVGAAIATAAVELALPIAAGLVLKHRNPEIFPALSVLPRVALAASLASVPAILFGLSPALAVVTATGLFALLLMALKAVPPELIAELRRHIPSPRGS
jgi:O-antigen/teichoic acid export membrane protein